MVADSSMLHLLSASIGMPSLDLHITPPCMPVVSLDKSFLAAQHVCSELVWCAVYRYLA